ncbi:MAG: hypothetical protein HQK83_04895 [Fibrobacteria bacterium]|nr:hypothetical protein [Fibrobacteria bacterium]
MNRVAIYIILFMLTSILAPAADWLSSGDNQNNSGNVSGTKEIEKEIRNVLTKPYLYFRRGNHKHFIELLKRNPMPGVAVSDTQSLSLRLESARRTRNAILCFITELTFYAHLDKSNQVKACQHLNEAAVTAGTQINDPHLALSVYQLARATSCSEATNALDSIQFYIDNDLVLGNLLIVNTAAKSDSELIIYKGELETAIRQHPESKLRISAMKKMGDLLFRLKQFHEMVSWYEKVIAQDSSLEKLSSIGYRINIANKVFLREWMMYGTYVIYAVLFILFLVRIIKSKCRFQFGFFLKRTALFMGLYGLSAAIILFLDSFFYFDAAMGLSQISYKALEPVIPLSIMDSSFSPFSLIILVLGFLPIFFVIFYLSFDRPYSRGIIIGIIILLLTSIWPHFFLAATYDDYLSTQSILRPQRIFMEGEMEKLLQEEPDKVKSANPDFLKKNNIELEIFIKNNIPGGLKRFDKK